MKKIELIKKLLDIPGDPDIVLLDTRKSLSTNDENGQQRGIYDEFEIESSVVIHREKTHIVSLNFLNEDYDDNGNIISY